MPSFCAYQVIFSTKFKPIFSTEFSAECSVIYVSVKCINSGSSSHLMKVRDGMKFEKWTLSRNN